MKKIICLTVILYFFTSGFSQSYQRAAGIRIGSSIGVSYKQFTTESRAYEGIADIDIIGRNVAKFKATFNYLFHYNLQPEGLAIYGGPGVSAGIYISGDFRDKLSTSIGLVGGIEYKFPEAPVVLAFDWDPKFQMITNAGLMPASFGLTLRYSF